MMDHRIDDDGVVETVRRAVAETIQKPLAEVGAEAALLQLGAQSIDFADIVLWLEREYRIELPRTCSIPNDQTVQDYVQAVRQRLRAR